MNCTREPVLASGPYTLAAAAPSELPTGLVVRSARWRSSGTHSPRPGHREPMEIP